MHKRTTRTRAALLAAGLLGGLLLAPIAALPAAAADGPCAPAVCIDNGTILLAVNPTGELNTPDATGSAAGPGDAGLTYLPTLNDATSPGCLCEGWGVADAVSGVTGWADRDAGTSGNLTVESFTFDASTATAVVRVADSFRVTHHYSPAPETANLYRDDVTIENISGADIANLLYRRVMDWDIEPTAFNEYVTIDSGSSPSIVFTSDNGFAVPDPLAGPSDLGNTGDFVDAGPDDHGALFDFDFGALASGDSFSFVTYYGAADTEENAKKALADVRAEAYSFGQPSTEDGPTLGIPNTFIFAFGDVGGAPLFAPTAVDDAITTSVDTVGSVNVLANDSDSQGLPLTVTTPSPTAEHGTVSIAADGTASYTPAAGYVGTDSFEYTVSNGTGSATATVTVTVTAPVTETTVPVAPVPTGTPKPTLAETGSDTGPLLALAFLALGAGACAVLFGRVRRTARR
jgi:hypothetical protein